MGTVFAMFIASFVTTFCLCACFLQRDKELCHEIEKQRNLAEHEAEEKHRALAEIVELKRHLSGSLLVPGTGPGEIERR